MFTVQLSVKQLYETAQGLPRQTVQPLGEADWVELQRIHGYQVLVTVSESTGSSDTAFMHGSPVCSVVQPSYNSFVPDANHRGLQGAGDAVPNFQISEESPGKEEGS